MNIWIGVAVLIIALTAWAGHAWWQTRKATQAAEERTRQIYLTLLQRQWHTDQRDHRERRYS